MGDRLQAFILDAIADAVLVTNALGRITLVNAAAARLTGWAISDATGAPVTRVLALCDEQTRRPLTPDPVSDAMAAGAPRQAPSGTALATRAGTFTAIELSATPLLGEVGGITGCVVVFRGRDHGRTEQTLRHEARMESIGRLASGVAHDFNNLLTLVSGDTEILLESRDLPASLAPLVREIQEAGARAAALTRQLLAFSRRQALRPAVIDLNDLINREIALVARVLGEDVEIVTAFEPALSLVRVDPQQMEQVILTLALNAREAMPRGGTLSFTTRQTSVSAASTDKRPELPDGPYAVLSIGDTGVRMDDDALARVFEPFFSTREMGRGTGLGLAAVYGVVKQSGGYIYVSSAQGPGTLFEVYLPSAKEALESPSPPHSISGMRGTETVLLVEDAALPRQRLADGLRNLGYTVMEASSGSDALQQCHGHGPIHVIVTDVIMPGMGGPEVARRLKNEYPNAKVLYISGYTNDIVARQGVDIDEAQWMLKPLSPRAVGRKIREMLDR